MSTIHDLQALREIIGEPRHASQRKDRDCLDKYDRLFLSMSPFVALATGSDGEVDVSVRGDPPGFVKVIDDRTVLIPERPGNRRADSMGNLMKDPKIAVIAFVPGVDETLRFHGRGSVVTDPELLAGTEVRGRLALVGIKIEITRVFFHCGKALMRSDLWGGRYKIERSEFPSLAQILHDQNWDGTLETIQEQVNDSYTNRLY
ncbi:MAG TPA: MSMEG_1061 family FMN-dependent PPOX-type flavoprotein [Streptosporangiaceae bacterium]|nr:MSMEG_1061 family FMN-dependent PPOX-type flavoprotein [Streptosporangiaceae bacterium]